MKKKILLFSATVGVLALALTSYQNGPASQSGGINMNKTGALSSGTCADAGCHNTSGNTLGSFSKIIDKSNGWDVTTGFGYISGHTYSVTLQGTSQSSKTNFGFQACVLYDGNQKPAGKLTALSLQTAVRPTKTITPNADTVYVVEHTSVIAAPSTIMNINFEWMAPDTGGAVKFWGIVNAVNNNGQSTGDEVSSVFSRVLANVTSVEELGATPNVRVYPNPLLSAERLRIKLENARPAEYTILAFDMSGRKMFMEQYTAGFGAVPFEYNTSDWAPGMYHVQIINKEGMKHTTPLIKY